MNYKKMDDETLMVKYQNNDLLAFEELYARHKDKAYGYLVKKLKDCNAADEVFQNAFVKLHRKRRQYDSQHSFLKWLFIITNSEMLDFLRKKDINTEFSEELYSPDEEVIPLAVNLAEVEGLSNNEKTALNLKYYQDYEYLEIANRLNTSQSNARKIVSRGVAKLRKAFAGGLNEK